MNRCFLKEEFRVALRHSIIHRCKPHKRWYLDYMLVPSLPILCINIRNNFGNNSFFGKNVTHIFNDTGKFISISTIYAIQYSCCKRLIPLWKKEKMEKIIQTMNLVRVRAECWEHSPWGQKVLIATGSSPARCVLLPSLFSFNDRFLLFEVWWSLLMNST